MNALAEDLKAGITFEEIQVKAVVKTNEQADMVTNAITYAGLHTNLRKGIRNGNWRRLNLLDKALYRASMWYAKHRCIVNGMLVTKLVAIIEKLKETKGMRIFKRGFEKAVEMLEKGEKNGVFAWAPRLKDWLKDPDYIFWLGAVR